MKMLIYDDAPEFGGHEQMVVRLVHHLSRLADVRVVFVLFEGNQALEKSLPPGVDVVKVPYKSAGAQVIRSYFSWRHIARLVGIFRAHSPDLLLVAQGGIAVSSTALFAGRIAAIPTVSYIPMTHDEGVYAPHPVKRWLRNLAVRPLHFLPQSFITISCRMADYLVARGVKRVEVVENGMEFPADSGSERVDVRQALGFADEDVVFLMVGRIEFWQKRQDLAMESFAELSARFQRARLLIVGEGPDLGRLRALADELGVLDKVVFAGWKSNVLPFYQACDCLLLPSRYEGVPLVMLEAMYLNRHVIASDIDGMADMLPAQWLFPSGDAAALARKMHEFIEGRMIDARALNRERIVSFNSIESFGRNFESCLRRLASNA